MDLLLLMAERMAPSSSELVRVAFWTRAGRARVLLIGGGEQVVVTVSVVLLLMLVFCDALLADERQVEATNQESRGMLPYPPCCPAMPAMPAAFGFI